MTQFWRLCCLPFCGGALQRRIISIAHSACGKQMLTNTDTHTHNRTTNALNGLTPMHHRLPRISDIYQRLSSSRKNRFVIIKIASNTTRSTAQHKILYTNFFEWHWNWLAASWPKKTHQKKKKNASEIHKQTWMANKAAINILFAQCYLLEWRTHNWMAYTEREHRRY